MAAAGHKSKSFRNFRQHIMLPVRDEEQQPVSYECLFTEHKIRIMYSRGRDVTTQS